jgi:hypothetical protein
MTLITVDPAIDLLVGGCVALLFGSAAAHKLRNLSRFREDFIAYGVPAAATRLGLPPLLLFAEMLVAAGLLFPASRSGAAGTAAVLLLIYAAAIAINLGRGRRDLACGCGGFGDRRRIAPWMIWRNCGMAATALVLVLPQGTRALEPTDAVTVGFGTATVAFVYLCIDGLLALKGRSADRLGAAS